MKEALLSLFTLNLFNQMYGVLDFLCRKYEDVMVRVLAIHLNILDLHLHSGNCLCLNGIHDVILNELCSSLKLKVPILHSPGFPYFRSFCFYRCVFKEANF